MAVRTEGKRATRVRQRQRLLHAAIAAVLVSLLAPTGAGAAAITSGRSTAGPVAQLRAGIHSGTAPPRTASVLVSSGPQCPVSEPSWELDGAASLSPSDAWAVGYVVIGGSAQCGTSTIATPTAEHWNGSAWAITTMQQPSNVAWDEVAGVAMVNTSDVWAVGSQMVCCVGPNEVRLPLIEQWNGSAWSTVQSPDLSNQGGGELNAVYAISGSDIWAVGQLNISSPQPLLEHWDGTAWTVFAGVTGLTDAYLTSVSGTSSTDVWGAGRFGPGPAYNNLIEHWNGSAWSQVPSPSPNPGNSNLLLGVAAVTPSDAWVVGGTGSQGESLNRPGKSGDSRNLTGGPNGQANRIKGTTAEGPVPA